MSKEMLINVSEGEECRIALVEDGKLQELYMERTSSTSHVGNIYKGRVTNVEPSIQAAFVDFGLGRNGFLHISDLMPSYFGERGEEITEAVGRKLSRRDRPPIQRCLRRGDEITVQIIKEGIGTKGPTLTTYLSIPGRILVMMPGMAKFGISRKIEDETERRRLRGILDGLKPIDEVGFIIRTAGVGKAKTEIDRDLKYLTRLWENITKKLKSPAPIELYAEGDLVTRTVRDVFTSEVERIVCDNKEVAKRIKEFFKIAMPRTKNKVELYDDPIPLFYKYDVEQELERMHSRHVPLPSGGSLVIDSTEAVVAIDVNSGKFRDHNDAEKTAFMTDMEAADEIPRQLKLRDLGGVIICDFIDLRFERNRRELEQRLHDNLKDDRAKTKVLRMSQFGIIEMTRQRMRASLKRSVYSDCPHCRGSGLVKTPESITLDVMRKLAIAISDARVQRVELSVCPDVAMYLLNKKRAHLAELEAGAGKRIVIKQDALLGLDEQKLQLLDDRDGLVFIASLGMEPEPPAPVAGGRGRNDGRRGRQDGRRDRNNRGPTNGRRDRPQEERFEDDEPAEARSGSRDEAEADEAPEAVEDAPKRNPRGENENARGRGRGGRNARPVTRGPAPAVDDSADDDVAPPALDDESVEEEGQVIDVNDANEPMGDAPGAMADEWFERNNNAGGQGQGRRRRRRGRGGQGRGRDAEQQANVRPIVKRENVAHDAPEPGNELPPPEPLDEEEDAEIPGPGNEKLPDDADGPIDPQPRKRRRRRGGRRHRARRERQGAEGSGPVGNEASPPADEHFEDAEFADAPPPPARLAPPTPERIPPARPRKALPEPIPRTGSSDKHLVGGDADVDDEANAVDPEPVRRPRSYRDLDELPDDMDD